MESFVYCWTDKVTNKLYVGSHKGTTNDGYICSSKLMLDEYKEKCKLAWEKRKAKKLLTHGGLA